MSFYRFTAVHDHTRAIRTLLRFWQSENYIPAPVHFDMPKLAKKRLLKLSAEQLQTIIKACHIRDRAVVLFMADSGLRRAEAVKLKQMVDDDLLQALRQFSPVDSLGNGR